jgi:hypothetical protein
MKKLLWTCLLAAPIFALPARAQAWCCFCCQKQPCQVDCGFSWHFNMNCGGCGCQAGPWYSYWPYEAHFQAPAPTGCFPYWPGPYGAQAGGAPSAVGAPLPAPAAAIRQSGFETTSYGGQAPSYWYGQ